MECHFLLQCMKVKSESKVAQSCPTLSDPMDCSPPGSSVHGIFQARVLKWGATAFSSHPLHSSNQGCRDISKRLRGTTSLILALLGWKKMCVSINYHEDTYEWKPFTCTFCSSLQFKQLLTYEITNRTCILHSFHLDFSTHFSELQRSWWKLLYKMGGNKSSD